MLEQLVVLRGESCPSHTSPFPSIRHSLALVLEQLVVRKGGSCPSPTSLIISFPLQVLTYFIFRYTNFSSLSGSLIPSLSGTVRRTLTHPTTMMEKPKCNNSGGKTVPTRISRGTHQGVSTLRRSQRSRAQQVTTTTSSRDSSRDRHPAQIEGISTGALAVPARVRCHPRSSRALLLHHHQGISLRAVSIRLVRIDEPQSSSGTAGTATTTAATGESNFINSIRDCRVTLTRLGPCEPLPTRASPPDSPAPPTMASPVPPTVPRVPTNGTGSSSQIRILQLNMARSATVAGEVNQLVAEKRLDVLLLQEPHVLQQGRSWSLVGLGTGVRVAATLTERPWAAVGVSNPDLQV